METRPDIVLPVIRDVLAKAPGTSAVDAFLWHSYAMFALNSATSHTWCCS